MLVYFLLSIAQAAGPASLPGPVTDLSSSISVIQTICTILNWIFFAAIVFAIIMILRAAFYYLTGGGNPDNITKAHKSLLYIAIGIAIAIFARTLPVLIGTIFGAGDIDPLKTCASGTTATTPRTGP